MQREEQLKSVISALEASVSALGASALASIAYQEPVSSISCHQAIEKATTATKVTWESLQLQADEFLPTPKRHEHNTTAITKIPPQPLIQTVNHYPQNNPADEKKAVPAPAATRLDALLAIHAELNPVRLKSGRETIRRIDINQGEEELPDLKDFAQYHENILEETARQSVVHTLFALNATAEEEHELKAFDKRTNDLGSVLPVLHPSQLENNKSYWWFYPVPVSTGFLEAADVTVSLAQANYPWFMIVTGATIAFFAAIGLTGKTALNNYVLGKQCFRHRAMPPEWPLLSRTKLYIALAINSITLPAGPLAEMMQTVFLINSIPPQFGCTNSLVQKIILGASIPIAGLVGTNKLLTDNVEGLAITVRVLAGKTKPFVSYFSIIVSLSVGILLGIFKALDDCVQAYMAYKQNFHIRSAGAEKAILSANLTIAPPSFSFTGILYINSIDKLIGYITRGKFKKVEIAGFLLTLGLAILLSYMMQPLNRTFYEQLASDLKVENALHSIWYDLFSWIIFTQKTVEVTASNTADVIEFLEKSPERLKRCYHYATSFVPSFAPAVATTGINLAVKTPAQAESDPDIEAPSYKHAESATEIMSKPIRLSSDDDLTMVRIAKKAQETTPLLSGSLFKIKQTPNQEPNPQKRVGCGIQ